LSLEVKHNVPIVIGERIYIGKDFSKRTKVEKVNARISYNDLTSTGKLEMEGVLGAFVKANEKRFVDFVNSAQPISLRFHMLELLPGLGKKRIPVIAGERRKGAFLSFNDINARTKIQIEKMIAKRIELELTNPDEKYHLFVPSDRK
jgi:putative nucleotide binding protein